MDPRFTALVAYVNVTIRQGSSEDAEVALRIAPSGSNYPVGAEFWRVNREAKAISSTISGTEAAHTELGPPVMLRQSGDDPFIQAQFLNVDGDEYFMNTLIYLWDINVRQLTGMGQLLHARGSN
jgi:hypothetical protein